MSKFFDIKDQVVQFPNDFDVVPSGQGGNVQTITAAFGTVSEAGTSLNELLLEGMQKNSIYSAIGTRTVETVNEIYDITITDLTDALIFNELKINLTVDADNTQSSNIYVRLDTVLYLIYLNGLIIPAGSLKTNGVYLMEFDGTRFNVDTNIKASEDQPGVAEIATQIEVDTGTDDEKIVTPSKLQNKIDDLYEDIGITIINSKVTRSTAYRIGKHITVSLRIDTGASPLPSVSDLVQLTLPSNLVVVRNHICTFATFTGASPITSNVDFSIVGLIKNNGQEIPASRRGTIELMFEIL